MIDNEIIKALETCIGPEVVKLYICNIESEISIITVAEITDLIKRQQAEIERLRNENQILSTNADTAFQDGLNEAQALYAEQVKEEIRAKAVKEFAEKLIRNITINNTNDGYLDYAVDYNCLIEDIQDLVEEMVGETNDR